MITSSISACPLDPIPSSSAPLLPDWLHDSTTTSVVERVTGESMAEPAPYTALAALAARGVELIDPTCADDFSLFVLVDALVDALGQLGFVLTHTRHLSPATLYARLHLRLTVEQLRLPSPGEQAIVDLLDIHCSEELRAYDLDTDADSDAWPTTWAQ